MPYFFPPRGPPEVLPNHINLTCEQNITIPSFAGVQTLTISCSVTSYLTRRVYKNGVLIGNSFRQNFTFPDDDYFGTYAFVASTEECGHAFAVSRILRKSCNYSYTVQSIKIFPDNQGSMCHLPIQIGKHVATLFIIGPETVTSDCWRTVYTTTRSYS